MRQSSSRVGAHARVPYIDLAIFALLSNTSRRSLVLSRALVFLIEWRRGQAELQAETPLWLGHAVVGQPHCTLVNEVSMLPPRGEVATCVLGNSWTGARGHAPRPQGLRSTCLLASHDQLESVAVFSLGYLLWP